METDRPDQTECSSVLKPGQLQLETGVLYLGDHEKQQDVRSASFNYATTLLRIGVFKSAELRLELGQYEKTRFITSLADSSSEGFSPFVIGTKLALCEENGMVPQIALLGHLELPFGNKKLITKNEVYPSFRFSCSHTLTSKLSLGYNLGMEWKSSSYQPDYVYTITLGASVMERMEAFVEAFGGFSASALPEHYFDLGAGFYLLKNLKIDVSGGFALNENSNDLFLSAGFSIRMPN